MKNDLNMNLAIDLINKYSKIYIMSHVQPDGDNIGSSLALAMALEQMDKKVFILKTDDIPSDYIFLPNVDTIKDYSESDEEIDLIIALDSSDRNRLGKNKALLNKAKNIINIDHHVSNENFGHINIVDTKAAATGELIYKLIRKMDVNIDKNIATCLYTAISTDTGSFMYDNVTYETHEIAAELIKVGIDKKDINYNLYQNKSLERINLFINAINNMELYSQDRIAIVSVTQKMLQENQAKMEDTEGIISFVRDIAPIEVACLLKEFDDNEIKVSLRSKNYIDVASICKSFNGGGHIRAAGCTIDEPLERSKELVLEEIIRAFG